MIDKDKAEIEKPSQPLTRLCEIGFIKGLSVEYKQTGTETSETYVTITGSNGEIKGLLWSIYKPFLDVNVGYNYVARVHSHMRDSVDQWKRFVKKNARELAEYKRLKAKFEK